MTVLVELMGRQRRHRVLLQGNVPKMVSVFGSLFEVRIRLRLGGCRYAKRGGEGNTMSR